MGLPIPSKLNFNLHLQWSISTESNGKEIFKIALITMRWGIKIPHTTIESVTIQNEIFNYLKDFAERKNRITRYSVSVGTVCSQMVLPWSISLEKDTG